MKRLITLATLALALLVALSFGSVVFAQEEIVHGPNFVDENGDGFHDLAPDADGDGIPNGMDEDYARSGNAQGKN